MKKNILFVEMTVKDTKVGVKKKLMVKIIFH